MLITRRGYNANNVLSPNWWAYTITRILIEAVSNRGSSNTHHLFKL